MLISASSSVKLQEYEDMFKKTQANWKKQGHTKLSIWLKDFQQKTWKQAQRGIVFFIERDIVCVCVCVCVSTFYNA